MDKYVTSVVVAPTKDQHNFGRDEIEYSKRDDEYSRSNSVREISVGMPVECAIEIAGSRLDRFSAGVWRLRGHFARRFDPLSIDTREVYLYIGYADEKSVITAIIVRGYLSVWP